MELPSFARLMKGPAIDWLVLKGDHGSSLSNRSPRGPALSKPSPRRPKNPFRYKPENRAGRLAATARSNEIFLADSEDREEYMIYHREVTRIIYYEDLMLEPNRQAAQPKKTRPKSFELLTALQRRAPKWNGITDRKHRLLFTEAAVHLKKQQPESALVVLEDLHDRNKSFSGLSRRMGDVTETLMTAAEQERRLPAGTAFPDST